jgi:hypothetical protein
VIVTGVGAGAIVIENAFCADPEAESLACTVKLNVPAVCGVPLILPPELSERPVGNDPLPATTLHVYGGVPPEAANDCEYDVPTIPPGNGDPVVIDTGVGAGAIVIANAFCADPEAESLACTVKLNVPVVCGLPLMTPPELSESPLGNDPLPATTLHV